MPGSLRSASSSLRHGVAGDLVVGDDDAGLGRQDRDRRDLLGRVVGQVLVEQRIGGERTGDGHAQRVAIGRGAGHRRGADIAARAGLVLDDERLAQALAQLVVDQPGHDIGRRAGTIRHDHLDRVRSARPPACACTADAGSGQASRGGEHAGRTVAHGGAQRKVVHGEWSPSRGSGASTGMHSRNAQPVRMLPCRDPAAL